MVSSVCPKCQLSVIGGGGPRMAKKVSAMLNTPLGV